MSFTSLYLFVGYKKAGLPNNPVEIFRQPGCLRETLGFLPHPRGWFSIFVYLIMLIFGFLSILAICGVDVNDKCNRFVTGVKFLMLGTKKPDCRVSVRI